MVQHTYCWQQILLHWVSAWVIGWTLVSGFYISVFDVEPSTARFVGFVNVGLTTLFIPVFLLRWLVRLLMARPVAVNDNTLARRAAHIVHQGMYWVTAMVLLSGVLMMDREIDVFGWFGIAPLLSDPSWLSAWLTLHVAANVVLALAVVMHVGAVVMHELAGRRVLRQMLP